MVIHLKLKIVSDIYDMEKDSPSLPIASRVTSCNISECYIIFPLYFDHLIYRVKIEKIKTGVGTCVSAVSLKRGRAVEEDKVGERKEKVGTGVFGMYHAILCVYTRHYSS